MYDVIGDVHGCYDELIDLLHKLGYHITAEALLVHPEGRQPVFVGDLCDRGPKNWQALDFVLNQFEHGLVDVVRGNHDDKLGRWLKGNPVSVGHGLQKTIDQLPKAPPKMALSDQILGWPTQIEYDDLIVCHAAPGPEHANLYGYPTGRQTDAGHPERGDWRQDWDGKTVVFGHVGCRDPQRLGKTRCVDTTCYAGNKLTALRWPEDEFVSVPSRQPDQEVIYFEQTDPPKVAPYQGPEATPVETLHLPTLLDRFAPSETLPLIDEDPDLNKNTHDGLVIANATQGLGRPDYEHQLYAKGIVYERDPYRLVSLPLIKMFNHSRHDVSDQTTYRVDGQHRWMEKADGTMIQAFAHDGKTKLSTRSILEGMDVKGRDYIGKARQMMGARVIPDDLTLIFELVFADDTEGVTRYGEDDLILLSVFDNDRMAYWPNDVVQQYAGWLGYTPPDTLFETPRIERGVERVGQLNDKDHVPEGAVLCVEDGGQIVHRLKVKTEEWIRRHKIKSNCSLKATAKMLWDRPSLWEWSAFKAFLQQEGLVDEEIEEFYRDHFATFRDWTEHITTKKTEVDNRLADFVGPETTAKEIALHFKGDEDFHLIMQAYRHGLDTADVMVAYPLYDGLKGHIIHERNQ